MTQGKTAGRADYSESLQQVLEGAKKAGQPVTERQLKRWRNEGLVPSPKRVGLGRGRGVVSLYPKGTIELVIAIARELDETRSLRDIAVRLWFRGAPVTDYVRDFVIGAFESSDQIMNALVRAFWMGLTDEPVRSALDDDRLPDYGWLRQSVGRKQFDVPVLSVIAMGAGDFPGENLELLLTRPDAVEALGKTGNALIRRLGIPEAVGTMTGEEMKSIAAEVAEQINYAEFTERARERDLAEWEQMRETAIQMQQRWAPEADDPEEKALAILMSMICWPDDWAPLHEGIDELIDHEHPVAQRFGRSLQKVILSWEM